MPQEINFSQLHDNYRVDVTEKPTTKITITYNNGQTKTIEDYCMQGAFGLKRLYELLSNLRLNQNWH